jgi:hypothetical protein
MVSIYGLRDPRTREIRYVGKTTYPLKHRLMQHLNPSRLRAKTYKNAWLKTLLNAGLQPEILLLEHVPAPQWPEAETRWIGQLPNLTNLTTGGDGTSGWVPPTEYRTKLSALMKGRVFTEDWRKKISESQRGRVFTDEHRARLSAAQRKRTHSEVTRQKMSRAMTGKTLSLDSRKRLSEARKGMTFSEEHRAALSVAARRPRTSYIRLSQEQKDLAVLLRREGRTLLSISTELGSTISSIAKVTRGAFGV